MRPETVFLLLLLTGACGRESERASLAEGDKPAAAPSPTVLAPKTESETPKLEFLPAEQPDPILNERLNWLRHDLLADLAVTITADGHVSAVEVVSVSPQGDALAAEFANESAARFRQARFQPLSGVDYPYRYKVTVRFAAHRDADGRLK